MILTAQQVAQYAREAGFTGSALVTAVAIAHAESGFNSIAVGDVNLTEQGERSVGLWQINYRPSRDQLGGLRDPNLNLDPHHCAVAAFAISGRGASFTPWSTFTSGAYRKFLTEAADAIAALSAPPTNGGKHMASTLVAIVAAPDGKGYWILASDGAVYAFGSAAYEGRLVLDANGQWEPG